MGRQHIIGAGDPVVGATDDMVAGSDAGMGRDTRRSGCDGCAFG